MTRQRRSHWHLGLTALLMIAAILAALVIHWQSPPPEPLALLPPLPPPAEANASAFGDSLYTQVEAVLAELGIWPELITKERTSPPDGTMSVDRIAVTVPGDLPLETVNLSVSRFVGWHGGRVIAGIQRHARRVDIRCGLDSIETTLFTLRQDPTVRRRSGRIAIVVDDFGDASGDQVELVRSFCRIQQGLTLAVLPNEGDVSSILGLAREHGHEIILHLPMEPSDYPESDPGEDAIFVHQDGETIRRLVKRALAHVPDAAGVNNHMGSRATADRRVMEAVLREVKDRELFFLDSRTSGKSLGFAVASAIELPVARRDLFIDPVDDDGSVAIETVERSLWELADLAAATGQAIGIGHDREETLRALESILPRLESRGHRFVPVSELAQ